MKLEDRLYGWGAYYRWRKGRPSDRQAGSIEGDYRSPQPWDIPPIAGEQYPFDLDDAMNVERAMAALRLADPFHALILKGKYCRRWPPETCMRVAWSDAEMKGKPPTGRDSFDACLAMGHVVIKLWLDAGPLHCDEFVVTQTGLTKVLDVMND